MIVVTVGGGSAGSVLANRLSEDANVTVLLIEAGGAPSFVTGIPALAAHIQLSPYDWQHKTVPQDNACLAMHNRVRNNKSYFKTANTAILVEQRDI